MKRKCAEPVQPRPKAGPGQLFVREFVDAVSGHAVRYRNVGVTPLQAAFRRGALENMADSTSRVTGLDRLAAGEIFEKLYHIIHANGTDSTQRTTGINGYGGLHEGEKHAYAVQRLDSIRYRMQAMNFAIVEAFIGERWELASTFRKVGLDVHPDGRAFRLREALDDLCGAVAGWR